MILAVAITCHDRAPKSERVVRAVLEQVDRMPDVTARFFVVDDGSSDDTTQRLRRLGVDPIPGDGELFWAGGMRLAQRHAAAEPWDWLLWLNDDVELAPAAVPEALAVACGADRAVWVGSTTDPITGRLNYGGRRQVPGRPLAFELVAPAAGTADTFNGNFVLLPRAATQARPFPAGYRHGYADLVYGMQLRRAGWPVRLLPTTVGATSTNTATGRMFDPAFSLRARWTFARSPFGIPPRDQVRFARDLGVSTWWALRSYARVLRPHRP